MEILEHVPEVLVGKRISLRYERTVPGDISRGLVPYYHFKLIRSDGTVVGHINFRVGETPHVRNAAGHIGFEILPEHRGQAYSLEACQTIAPFVRSHYSQVIITTDPTNEPSKRIIEQLGASFLGEVEVPINDPAYEKGARRKMRFEWRP